MPIKRRSITTSLDELIHQLLAEGAAVETDQQLLREAEIHLAEKQQEVTAIKKRKSFFRRTLSEKDSQALKTATTKLESEQAAYEQITSQFIVENLITNLEQHYFCDTEATENYRHSLLRLVLGTEQYLQDTCPKFYPLLKDKLAKILDDLNNQKNAENIFQALLQYLQLCQQIISNYAYYKKHDAIPKQQQDELELATEWLRISLFKLIKLSQANSENTVVPQKQKHETADHYELRLIDWMQSLERYPLFKLAFHNGKIEKTASTTNTQETIDERAKQQHLTSAELAIRFAEHIGQIKTRKKPDDTTLNITQYNDDTWSGYFSGIADSIFDFLRNSHNYVTKTANDFLTKYTYQPTSITLDDAEQQRVASEHRAATLKSDINQILKNTANKLLRLRFGSTLKFFTEQNDTVLNKIGLEIIEKLNDAPTVLVNPELIKKLVNAHDRTSLLSAFFSNAKKNSIRTLEKITYLIWNNQDLPGSLENLIMLYRYLPQHSEYSTALGKHLIRRRTELSLTQQIDLLDAMIVHERKDQILSKTIFAFLKQIYQKIIETPDDQAIPQKALKKFLSLIKERNDDIEKRQLAFLGKIGRRKNELKQIFIPTQLENKPLSPEPKTEPETNTTVSTEEAFSTKAIQKFKHRKIRENFSPTQIIFYNRLQNKIRGQIAAARLIQNRKVQTVQPSFGLALLSNTLAFLGKVIPLISIISTALDFSNQKKQEIKAKTLANLFTSEKHAARLVEAYAIAETKKLDPTLETVTPLADEKAENFITYLVKNAHHVTEKQKIAGDYRNIINLPTDHTEINIEEESSTIVQAYLRRKVGKINQQKAVAENTQEKSQANFYIRLQTNLRKLFATALALQENKIRAVHVGATGYAASGLLLTDKFTNNIVPGLGSIGLAMNLIAHQREISEAKKIARLTVTDKTTQQFIETLALAVTKHFNTHPIEKLCLNNVEEKSSKTLANFVTQQLALILLSRAENIAEHHKFDGDYTNLIEDCLRDLTQSEQTPSLLLTPNRFLSQMETPKIQLKNKRTVAASTFVLKSQRENNTLITTTDLSIPTENENHETLHQKKAEKLSKEKSVTQNITTDSSVNFYSRLKSNINNMFAAAQAIQSGKIKTVHMDTTGWISDGLSVLAKLAPWINLFTNAMDFYNQKNLEKEAKKIAELCLTVKASRHFINDLTLAITEHLNKHPVHSYRLKKINNPEVLADYVAEKLMFIFLHNSKILTKAQKLKGEYTHFIQHCVNELTQETDLPLDELNRRINRFFKTAIELDSKKEIDAEQLLQTAAIKKIDTIELDAKAKIETVLFNPIFAELTAIALPERDFNKLRVTKALYPTGLAVMKALQLPHRNKNNYQRGDVLSNPKNKNRPGVLLLSRKEDGIMPGVLGVVINQGFYQVVAEIIHKQLTAKQETLAARLHDAIDLRIDSTGQTTWDNWKNIVASEFNNDAANEIFVRHFLANKACKELLLPEIEQAIKQNDPRLVKQLYKGTYFTSSSQGNDLQGDISGIKQTKTIKNIEAKVGRLSILAAEVWHTFSGKDRKEKNFDIVMEGLANALFTFYNLTQEQDVVTMQDWQGRENIVLAGTWNNSFRGLTKHLVTDGKHGHLVTLDQQGTQLKTHDGFYLAENNIHDLGRALPFMLLCEDDDGIGSRAQNKGYVPVTQPDGNTINKFFVIDCGHAFAGPAKLIKDLSNDFSIPQSKLNSFKNFSILFDADITEAMESIHILNKLRTGREPSQAVLDSYPGLADKLKTMQQNQDTAIFDAYMETFGSKGDVEEQNYYKEHFAEAKQNYENTANRMLNIFEQRLSLTAQELTLLDNLEKLTSETTNIATMDNNKVILNHLKKTKRTEWTTTLTDNGEIIFTIKNFSKKAQQAFENYLALQKDFTTTVTKTENSLQIVLPRSQATTYLEIFREDLIIKHKSEIQPEQHRFLSVEEKNLLLSASVVTEQQSTTATILASTKPSQTLSEKTAILLTNLEKLTSVEWEASNGKKCITFKPKQNNRFAEKICKNYLKFLDKNHADIHHPIEHHGRIIFSRHDCAFNISIDMDQKDMAHFLEVFSENCIHQFQTMPIETPTETTTTDLFDSPLGERQSLVRSIVVALDKQPHPYQAKQLEKLKAANTDLKQATAFQPLTKVDTAESGSLNKSILSY